MGMSIEETYILEDVTGSEWVVISSSATLKNGWKAFAVDYQLEKGDQIMFGLVAPKRFYVSVFDKSGMEKVSTRQHLNSMGSTGTAMDKESELAPQVSKPMSGGAEDPCTPMNLAHSKGATRRARSNDTSQHNSQLLVSNDVGALPSRNASDQNGNQKGILCNGVSINSHLPNEPVVRTLDSKTLNFVVLSSRLVWFLHGRSSICSNETACFEIDNLSLLRAIHV